MVQLSLTVAILANLVTVIGAIKRQTYTYGYKQGSNQAYTSSSWIGTDCLADSYISIFATDGFYKENDAKQTPFKSVSGSGSFYTSCNAKGAKYSQIFFAETANPRLVAFRDQKTGKNATISATMEAYLFTQPCTVESYTDIYDGVEYTYYYYICEDDYTETFTNITIDSFLKVIPGTDIYTDKSTQTSTFRGTVEKFESESSCQDAIVTRKVVKIGKTRLNIPSFSTYGEICKATEGYVTTTKFI